MNTKKITWACNTCGGDNVSIEAVVHWDTDEQRFAVSEVCDKGHYCEDCDGECGIVEKDFVTTLSDEKPPFPATLVTADAIVRVASEYVEDNPDEFDDEPNVAVANGISHAFRVFGIDEPPMNDALGELYERVHALHETTDTGEDAA